MRSLSYNLNKVAKSSAYQCLWNVGWVVLDVACVVLWSWKLEFGHGAWSNPGVGVNGRIGIQRVSTMLNVVEVVLLFVEFESSVDLVIVPNVGAAWVSLKCGCSCTGGWLWGSRLCRHHDGTQFWRGVSMTPGSLTISIFLLAEAGWCRKHVVVYQDWVWHGSDRWKNHPYKMIGHWVNFSGIKNWQSNCERLTKVTKVS
jgi:hypothetical protein